MQEGGGIMIDVNELGNKNAKIELNIKLATVTNLSENETAMVTFYGEEEESQKGYSYLKGYYPTIDDVVLMMPIGDAYIIIGRIMLNTDTPIKLISQEDMNNAISGFVTSVVLEQTLTNYLTTVAAESCFASKNHAHTEYTTEDKIEEYIGWSTVYDTMSNTSNFYNDFKNLSVSYGLKHTGSLLGFFGKTPAQKLSIADFDTTTTSTSTIIGYSNQILALLRRYGLT